MHQSIATCASLVSNEIINNDFITMNNHNLFYEDIYNGIVLQFSLELSNLYPFNYIVQVSYVIPFGDLSQDTSMCI